jgi:formate hydrogenlyase subunit 4
MTLLVDAGIALAGILAVTAFAIVVGLVFQGIDRKVAAHMQARIGPPLRQPFTDIGKLMSKESVVPENAIPFLFNVAPVISLASAITILFYLPIGIFPPVLSQSGDVILVMYLLTVPALAMVVGGFASGSPYATVGAQREMVTIMAYELPIAVIVIAIAWTLAHAGIALPFALTTILQYPIWGLVGPVGALGALLLLLVLLFVIPAEVSRIPFDSPEAETELAGGSLVEYSGRNLVIFQRANGVKMVVLSAFVVALFFPYTITGWLNLGFAAGAVADLLFFLLKIAVVIFFSISLIRLGLARFRISQVVTVYLLYIGIIALVGLGLIVADVAVI